MRGHGFASGPAGGDVEVVGGAPACAEALLAHAPSATQLAMTAAIVVSLLEARIRAP